MRYTVIHMKCGKYGFLAGKAFITASFCSYGRALEGVQEAGCWWQVFGLLAERPLEREMRIPLKGPIAHAGFARTDLRSGMFEGGKSAGDVSLPPFFGFKGGPARRTFVIANRALTTCEVELARRLSTRLSSSGG